MKLTANKSDLSNAFQTLAGVVPARTTKTVLSCVRLTGKKGTIRLEATDLDTWVRMEIPAEVEGEWDVLLPASVVGGMLRELRQENVELSANGNSQCRLASEGTVLDVQTADPGEFPAWPELKAEAKFSIDAGTFADMLRRTAFAAARERTRYALNGVALSLDPKKVEAVATDGRRLAMSWKDGGVEGNGRYILSTRCAGLLEKVLGESAGEAKVELDKHFLSCESGSVKVLSRLVEGEYPEYQAVIPKGQPETFEMERGEFESALRRAMLVTSATSAAVALELKKGKVKLVGQSSEMGRAEVEMPAEYKGKGTSARFNPHFLLEGVKGSGSEKIRMEMKDSTSAAVMRMGDGYLYVVLPIHVS